MDADELLEVGRDRLHELLGSGWEVGEYNTGVPEPANLPISLRGSKLNHIFNLKTATAGVISQVLVEPTTDPSPSAIFRSLAPRLDLMRQLMGDAAVLVVAEWLSPRTRQLLQDQGYGYLDLTGNVWLHLPRGGVHIKTVGEQRDPSPRRRPWRQQLRGEKAGRLVRVLVDVAPPYRGTDLAKASGLSQGYVSRLLDAMADQQLIRRQGREIVNVDWVGLLRERASSYSLLNAHPPIPMVAQRGIDHVLFQLQVDQRGEKDYGRVAVTGSIAAAKVAPLAVGGQLMVHLDETHEDALATIRRHLSLLPTESGADVLLLHSTGSEALLGRRLVDGVPHVAYSQLVLDCLGGPGRMPAEGESLLEYLQLLTEESTWRRSDLDQWSRDWQ